MKLQWSERALGDIARLRDHIAQDSPFYARQFTERLVKRTESLPEFPRMGRTVPEANRNDIRELIYQGYRIIYQVDDAQQIASVVAVIHGSRNISDPDNQPY
jgi:addiction module RelE/StbE family toxin